MKNFAIDPIDGVWLGPIFIVMRNDGQTCGMYPTKAEARAKIAWRWKRMFPSNTFYIDEIPAE